MTSEALHDVDMADAPTTPAPATPVQSGDKLSKSFDITTRTIRASDFAYVHLELVARPASTARLDELTARRYVTAALTQFLGVMGSAMTMDVLKVEGTTCWVRVARQDLSTVVAAAGGWVGGEEDEGLVSWRVRASGNWLGSLARSRDAQHVWG